MKVLVTGSSGLVGSALVPFLTAGGHHVVRLVRRAQRPGEAEVRWDPAAGRIDRAGLEGLDAVVHLAGESIADGYWSEAKKARIRSSRVDATRLMAAALAEMTSPPRVWVSASAVGYYGSRGDDVLTEDSPPGRGFLAEVCRDWEAATEPAGRAGVRVVRLRLGVVLTPAGGALARMLTPFRLGLGGRLGAGRQYVSWIALDDLLGAILHALGAETLDGPVNAVSPRPVTNQELTKTLGRVLRRPTLVPTSAFALRLILGDMANEVLLAGQRVQPAQLLASGYSFKYPDLESALRHVLGRT